MLTFQNIYEEVQEQTQDDSATTLAVIKRAINQGMEKFGAVLNREWRTTEKTFSIVADQQFYQVPEDCTRVKTVVITIGDVSYQLEEIADEQTWNDLNMYRESETSDIPTHFYAKGSDQFGIYPIPSSSVSNAGLLSYEPRMRKMTAADYTTGSIAVTNGSAAVVGTGTTLTAQMVGRTLFVADGGDQEGIGYKIASFTDTTHVTLENTYAGLTGSGKSYVIGEVPDIPSEYHESLIDYGCYRVYLRRRDFRFARDMKRAFENDVEACKENYGSMTASQYVRAIRLRSGLYSHHRRDYKVDP